jgi:hypothetical protein
MGGPEYIHAVLVGYEEPPECAADFESDGYYNKYFAKGAIPDTCKDEHGVSTIEGSWIAMPQPLSDDQVTYTDGTAATMDQMSMDVSSFLMWAAEPKLMARKEAGFVSVIFLIILSTLLYLTNKRLWAGVKGKKTAEQGAGDQGLMFGFACTETPELMPTPVMFAHRLGRRLTAIRKAGKVKWLRPDAKSQVSVRYEDGKPVEIVNVVISTQHTADVDHGQIESYLIDNVIKKELPKGFQRSEFLLEKGQIDRIVPRAQMRDELARFLAYATGRDPVAAFKPQPVAPEPEPVVAPPPPTDDGKARKKAKAKKA